MKKSRDGNCIMYLKDTVKKIFKACIIMCDIHKESNYTQVYSVMQINY